MFEFFAKLFNTSDFPDRWHCGVWTSGHGWLHILSDFATFGAYMTIPFVILFFLRKRPNVPFPRLFYLFAAFIFACGTVHLIEATIFWWPIYRVSAVFKFTTAIVSWATVIGIVASAPRALRMRSPEELEKEIQERKKIERALRQSEERLSLAFQATNDAIWDCDLESGTVWWNDAYDDLFDERPPKTGDSWQWWIDHIHPDDRERVSTSLKAAGVSAPEFGDRWNEEYQYRCADGSYRYVADRAVIARDEAGKPTRLLGAMSDITLRKESEINLRSQARVLEQVAKDKSLADILNTQIEVAEEAHSEMIGSILLFDEKTGQLRHGASNRLSSAFCKAIDGVVAGPEVGSCGTAAFTGKRVVVEDIQTHPFWKDYRDLAEQAGLRACWSEPIISSGGKVLGTFATYYRDPRSPIEQELRYIANAANLAALAIERIGAEDALRDREKHYRTVVETSGSVVILMSPENKILQWNTQAERVFGYSRAEALGQDVVELINKDESRDDAFAITEELNSGKSFDSFEFAVVDRDGNQRMLLWNAAPMLDSDGQPSGFYAVGQDITELKTAQEQLIQSERLSAIGQAMTGLIHESRNALARGQAGLKLLEREIGDRPDLFRYIDESLAAQEDLQHLFEEVRQYAVPPKLVREPVNVSHVVRGVWEQLSESRGDRDAELIQEFDGVEIECELDSFMIGNAFRNFIENSLAACSDPARITVRYQNKEYNGKPALEINFQDNGPGLDDDQAKHIFDAFYTTKTHGTGLGMAISKRSIESHNGALKLSAPNGHGAEFVITLPKESA